MVLGGGMNIACNRAQYYATASTTEEEVLPYLLKMTKQVLDHQILTPDIESHAGLNLWYGYLNITGCTGAPDRNAPDLNGRRKSPFVVVPSIRIKKTDQNCSKPSKVNLCKDIQEMK